MLGGTRPGRHSFTRHAAPRARTDYGGEDSSMGRRNHAESPVVTDSTRVTWGSSDLERDSGELFRPAHGGCHVIRPQKKNVIP